MCMANKLKKYDIIGMLKVSDILYKCGKDMAKNQDLRHWDNSHIKNWVIVALCALKNDIYLVTDGRLPVATFQTRTIDNKLLFRKLAISPKFSGKGIGTRCLAEIEKIAAEHGCGESICEVYEKSEHAIKFYEHRGYTVCGTAETLKYKELKMRKEL